jgi:multiple sugar transport system substrate-binding protein
MFLVDWYTRFITVGGVLMSGSPTEKNFAPNLTSSEAVAALQNMVDCVELASDGVLEYDFTASTDSFAAGKTAMMLMWSTIAGTMYNPDSSTVADKIGVAVSPGIGADAGKAIRGGWGLGIPKNAQNKDAAWQVITYFTSKEYEKFQAGEFQKDPSRLSTYADPELTAKLPYLPVAGQVLEKAQILEIALIPETFELITLAAEDFSAALNGSASAADACQKAQDRWVEVLKRGGYLT